MNREKYGVDVEPTYRRPFDKATGEYWDQDELEDNWREILWGPRKYYGTEAPINMSSDK